ncbi:DUF4440 domain-containing protein [Phytomonospora endophytica]|uniref:DUF4440 domain-containing protein n=1 Tax=Phytomonospora endophytica TaxID=714109 RepID=A0A841FIN3_9ACTN|nr:DUF4440 domain-containing protein [Phytomonospora endophytica]MBB6036066.1 hypothetical protein [Phytomonospora endophytica]GIG66971.1 hypothetical protein Pen01_32660 [Phytomonospora endophytica]
MSKKLIDDLTADFFGAFDNRGGTGADVARLRRLMIPGGVVVCTQPFTTYTVDEFIEPRERLLADGRLTGFAEWETSEETVIADGVATRIGEYRKSGVLEGEPFEGGGTKTFQFAMTPEGWRITAFAWRDHA